MGLFVASAPNGAERVSIAGSILHHWSKATHDQLIVPGTSPSGDPAATIVRLTPPRGWQFDFWKLLRDVAVWDPDLSRDADWSRYLYFFVGRPSDLVRRMNVQDAPIEIAIRGCDLLDAMPPDRVFWRKIDSVLVVRGDYVGPARLTPPPPR